jgi:uncharacterized protein (DUF169 family)
MLLTAEQTSTLSKLALANAPVAMAFVPTPPESVSRIDHTLPASCSYWKAAAAGRTFATAADDHGGCPVGGFTHGVELSQEKANELQSIIGMMTELKYIKKEEIPLIPHRTEPMRFAVYSPLSGATFSPDAVIFIGNARQIMLLSEAARAAGVFDAATVMGRPACAMVPQAVNTQAGVASVGCIGNRVYTGLDDSELYLTVPGAAVGRLLEHLETVLAANTALEQFHEARNRVIEESGNRGIG